MHSGKEKHWLIRGKLTCIDNILSGITRAKKVVEYVNNILCLQCEGDCGIELEEIILVINNMLITKMYVSSISFLKKSLVTFACSRSLFHIIFNFLTF